MKLILVMVTSLDGKSTKGNASNTHIWNSEEDQKHFQTILESASLLIMGSKTYEAARDGIEHKDGRLRIVVTRTPEKYDTEQIPNQLEFTNLPPEDIVRGLEERGYKEGYLVGGAHTNTEFFKRNLVTELWQTLEPKILGQGNGLVGEEEMDVTLELITSEQMNKKGTLLLKYRVITE